MSGSGNTSANSSNATGGNDALVGFLRDSPASIEALGRGLAASLSPLILSSLRSQAVAPQITQPPLSQPGGGASYGLQDQSLYHFHGGCYHGQLDQSSSSHLRGGLISGLHSQASITPPVSTPGVVGSHPSTSGHNTSLSSIHSEDSSSQVSDLGDWQHLVDYNVSDQDRRDLDEPATSTRVAQETSDLITAAFNKPLEASKRSRLMERFPRPATPLTAPPPIDKAMKVLIQKKKSIMSHDRFLSKLQRYTTDAIGPLAFLLDAIHQSRELSQEDIVEALQSAISLVGNAHCALNMERRRCILNQLNTQLVPMAEEVESGEGSLFGSDFGKKAKERMDSIKSLTQSSSVFFRLGDPPRNKFNQGQGGRGKGPANRYTPYRKKGSKWNSTPVTPSGKQAPSKQ